MKTDVAELVAAPTTLLRQYLDQPSVRLTEENDTQRR